MTHTEYLEAKKKLSLYLQHSYDALTKEQLWDYEDTLKEAREYESMFVDVLDEFFDETKINKTNEKGR